MLNINPFKKKQRFQEEQGGSEPYFPPDLERFRAQPAEPSIIEVPERERKFRAFTREIGEGSNTNPSITPTENEFPYLNEEGLRRERIPQNKPIDNADKIDMVLQKLETIDLRLRLIEQKLERRPI